MALESLLQHIPYLAALEWTHQQYVCRNATRHHFNAEQIIFLEGMPADGVWIIETGQVKISRYSPTGAEYILHLLGPTQSFNDIAALENGTNPATATALAETLCWCVSVAIVQEILEQSTVAAKAAILMLTQRIRTLAQQLEDLALHDVRARLARYLLEQATESTAGMVTRATIAAHLATTPESISRALRSLANVGAIQFNRHQIIIQNPHLLALIADSETT